MRYYIKYIDGPEDERVSYKETLEAVARELKIPARDLIIEPDSIDGNQYEIVFEGNKEFARIYTEDQWSFNKH